MSPPPPCCLSPTTALAAERADRLLVFRHGEIQEQGSAATLVSAPQHPYTRQLLQDAVPDATALPYPSTARFSTPAIQLSAIDKQFTLGRQQTLTVAKAVSLTVPAARRTRWWVNPAPAKPRWRAFCLALNAPIAAKW